MSLFSHRREYEQSFNRIFQDLSVDIETHKHTDPKKNMAANQNRLISIKARPERYGLRRIQNFTDGAWSNKTAFIQNDKNAWGDLLARKRRA